MRSCFLWCPLSMWTIYRDWFPSQDMALLCCHTAPYFESPLVVHYSYCIFAFYLLRHPRKLGGAFSSLGFLFEFSQGHLSFSTFNY
jgi:hypothetical protein